MVDPGFESSDLFLVELFHLRFLRQGGRLGRGATAVRSGTRRGSVAGTDAASGRDSNQTEKSVTLSTPAADSDSFRSARQASNPHSVRDPSGFASRASIGAIPVATRRNVARVHVRPHIGVELIRARRYRGKHDVRVSIPAS